MWPGRRGLGLGSGGGEVNLTAELNADEVLDPQVLQEDSGGSGGLEQEGDFGAQLGVKGGEVEVGSLRVEGRCVPVALWQTKKPIRSL